MTSLPTVLILTYPEHGQANVNLAISYELALAGVNVYIASFASLRPRVSRLQALINRHASHSSGTLPGSAIFRECKGVTPNWEASAKYGIHDANLPHPYGVLGAAESYSKIGSVLFFWNQEEYLAAITSIKEIIANTKPDVVGVDPLFFAAQDACKLADQKFMIISPTGLKESVVHMQPYMATFWKYPALSSGFPFPLKWWQIPLNIYLHIRSTMLLISSTNIKQTYTLRASLGLKDIYGLRPPPGMTYICPALAEIDFPFTIIPKDILTCGPILIPFDPLEESDPEIARRFRREPRKGDGYRILVAWLDAEPISILQHANVVCAVHHGGANSFYEGVWSGVPHIVLPVWFDTYDYAQRAEFLNIGIFGNRTCAPGVRAEEFGKALVRVTGDSEEAVQLRMSAKHLKEVCRAKGTGRKLACAAILKEVGSKE
ncbi:hypothetical protein JVT61DRAFT_10300 [Boletus reticuloceps]|uniref:Glycosyltransferase n=1 Tax=Boletus reticuloceps TaxID=495285 RepID=A0A8I3AC00_9AGAM|nr:hypothetical protein JVT61DRAFT_10300 [Boletus reticuloceps]